MVRQALQHLVWRLERVDLPASSLSAERQQAVQIIGSLFRTLIRPDMAGLQTVSDGQQIHTEKWNFGFQMLSIPKVPCFGQKAGPAKG